MPLVYLSHACIIGVLQSGHWRSCSLTLDSCTEDFQNGQRWVEYADDRWGGLLAKEQYGSVGKKRRKTFTKLRERNELMLPDSLEVLGEDVGNNFFRSYAADQVNDPSDNGSLALLQAGYCPMT